MNETNIGYELNKSRVSRQVLFPVALGLMVLLVFFLIDLCFVDYTFLTRYQDQDPVSPLYAFYIPAATSRVFVPLLAGALFITMSVFLLRWPFRVSLFVIFAFMVIIRASFSFIRHDLDQMGIELLTYPGEEIIFDLPLIRELGPERFLERYPELMPTLSLHGQHFPPGYGIFLYYLSGIVGDVMTRLGWALVLLSSTVVFPIMLLARRIFGEDRSAVAAGVLLVLFPSSVTFGAVSLSALFAAMAAWPIYILVEGFHSAHRKKLHFLCGILLGLAVFFSFSAFLLGLLVVFLLVLRYGYAGRRALIGSLILIGIGFLSVPAFSYLFGHFDFCRCFLVALERNEKLIMNLAGGEKTWPFHIYSIWGNYVAFFIGIGFPLFGLAAAWLISRRFLFKTTGTADQMGIALFGLVFLSGAAGLFYMETERIWLFLAVLFVLPATAHLKPLLHHKAWLLCPILLFVQTLVQEVLLFSLW